MLKAAAIKVFYDDYEKVALWGKDLYEHLDWIYRSSSRYCVLFISRDYARKVWTSHERKSAQARALEENKEYVLPVRFDETDLPGIRPTVGYLDANVVPPKELARLIYEKLGPRTIKEGFPSEPDRLWGALKIRSKSEKRRVQAVGSSFYRALRRMTSQERRTVLAVLAFGCAGELPSYVHISLDYLRRMTGMPAAELLEHLGAIRSLNFKARTGVIGRGHAPGELAADDLDIQLSFWCAEASKNDGTSVAYWAVGMAADHFCEDHGLKVVESLDFHGLSSIIAEKSLALPMAESSDPPS